MNLTKQQQQQLDDLIELTILPGISEDVVEFDEELEKEAITYLVIELLEINKKS